MNPGTMQDPAKLVDAAVPPERMVQAAEIAAVVTFLAGDGASHLTATTILVDGGVKGGVGL